MFSVVESRSVAGSPAENPQGSVRTDFDIRRAEQGSVGAGEDLQSVVLRLEQRAVPNRVVGVGDAALPVVDEERAVVLLRELIGQIADDARSGAFEQRTAGRSCRRVILAEPVVAPGMAPAEVGSEERHEDLVALRLIVVRAEPVEAGIEGDVPRIAEASADDLQVRTVGIAAEDSAHAAAVVGRVVVRCECLRRREVGRAFRRLDVPEFAEWFRSDSPRLRQAF